jgi:multiple sugar transport system permease protein
VAIYIPCVIFLVFALFPFYWMLITSMKADTEIYNLDTTPYFWSKAGPVLSHYVQLFAHSEFPLWMVNSLTVAAVTTAISLTIGVMAGYSLSRLRFFGAKTFGMGIFITYLVPPTLLFIPLSQVINQIGVSDSLWALFLSYPTFLVPFCTWLLMGYFKTIPKELEECAMIDGCTRVQALLRIVLPLAIPGIVCAGLFSFTLSWGEFLYALTFILDTEQKTLPVGVTSDLIRGDVYYWGGLMAAALLGSVPIALLYSFFLDYFVSGLTAGAIK